MPAMSAGVHQPMPAREARPDGAILVRAPAKLNLALRVRPLRDDGFHEIDSIVAKVTLYDELLVRPRDDGEIRLECGPFDCGPGESNLVYRAARMLAGGAAALGADITLTKRIPPGAGLGGGSSDAAAALAALNDLWELNSPPERLAEMAAELGSDAPLFLAGPSSRVTGRGECVEPVGVPPFFALLHIPDLACPTAEVYAAWDEIGQSGQAIEPAAFAGPPSQWADALVNDLQPAAWRVCPALAEVADSLLEATKAPIHLTGSGSAMFIIAADEAHAHALADALPADLAERSHIVQLNLW